MVLYSGYEYLLIDIANNYGLDKQTFETRIQWTQDHLTELETLRGDTKSRPLYLKAVMALRDAQKGIPSGHLVGFDAVCSGVQIMSVLTGCVAGATATGLVDPDVRADAYSSVTTAMNGILGTTVAVSRADAKDALMTAMYGSKDRPKEIFGEDSPELNAFYAAANEVAPGAWELLQDLLASWQPYALSHEWKLPDGFDVRVKVMDKKVARIEVDELDHATFTYEFYENSGMKKGKSNVANVVHSIDGYILRCIHRRCNYDLEIFGEVFEMIELELLRRSMGTVGFNGNTCNEIDYYIEQYDRSGMVDVVIVPYLDDYAITKMTTKHLQALVEIIGGMLEYKPFEVVTIHDEFKCHPNNMNHLRQQYINVLAELADSNVLSDVLSQILGTSVTYQKLSNDLSRYIRGSNYGLS